MEMGPVVAPVVAPAAVPPSQSVFKQPQPVNPNSLPFFSRISEDILVNVLSRLEDDPRDLARLACVCRRFTNVIRTSCWRHQCMRVLPTVVSELMQSSSQPELLGEPPCGWGSLQKLLVCCPGLRHAGVLLDCFDFGLERAIGKSDDYQIVRKEDLKADASAPSDGRLGSAVGNDVDPHVDGKFESEKSDVMIKPEGSGVLMENKEIKMENSDVEALASSSAAGASGALCQYENFDLKAKAVEVYHHPDAEKPLLSKRKKTEVNPEGPVKQMKKGGLHYHNKMMKDSKIMGSYLRQQAAAGEDRGVVLRTQRSIEWHPSPDKCGDESSGRMTIDSNTNCNHEDPHLAKGIRMLTREQGNKLLASRSVVCIHPHLLLTLILLTVLYPFVLISELVGFFHLDLFSFLGKVISIIFSSVMSILETKLCQQTCCMEATVTTYVVAQLTMLRSCLTFCCLVLTYFSPELHVSRQRLYWQWHIP